MCIRDSVIDWAEYCGLTFLPCDCPAKKLESDTKRAEIKQLLKTLRETNPDVEKNVFSAIHAVSLDTMPGWKIGEKEYSFLDDYDNWEATHRPADK